MGNWTVSFFFFFLSFFFSFFFFFLTLYIFNFSVKIVMTLMLIPDSYIIIYSLVNEIELKCVQNIGLLNKHSKSLPDQTYE